MSLTDHLSQVAGFTEVIARELQLDIHTARMGALLHDIGKASTRFQPRLRRGYRRPDHKGGDAIFRHEIASLFFLSFVPEASRGPVVEMIAGHHKSTVQDIRKLGLVDLHNDEESFRIHSRNFEQWRHEAIGILHEVGFFGLEIPHEQDVTLLQARESYEWAVEYCRKLDNGWSAWKGVLMAADQMASALFDGGHPDRSHVPPQTQLEAVAGRLFVTPDLSYYGRRSHALYPLSELPADDSRPHTLVTAPTGAGKTDYLLRRCRGRVFYTLPFQASINAMYDRIRRDLADTPADVRLLHASSTLKIEDGKLEEKILQRHIGASVKVMTPHQIAAIVFGVKGYEAMLADLKECDVILDEIHTYSDTMQAIVLKIVEILAAQGCRLHVGTATMPAALYGRIWQLLGGPEQVLEVSLPAEVLDTFDRHIVHKLRDFEQADPMIDDAVAQGQKVLVVCNQVARAQAVFAELSERYETRIPVMLIHSRFRRGDRAKLETRLTDELNAADSGSGCIVVSTQVVEVSLDISFDVMVTECAPLDALIQRFGRINRRRSAETIGRYKSVYVIAPPGEEDKRSARPYSADVLNRSYELLPDGDLLKERDMQHRLDALYAAVNEDIPEVNLGMMAVYGQGRWRLRKLMHRAKSALLEVLDIDTVACVTQRDAAVYRTASRAEQMALEITVSYNTVGRNGLQRLEEGSAPYVIPDRAYSEELGFLREFATPEYEDITPRFL